MMNNTNYEKYCIADIGKVITGKTPSSKNPDHYGDIMPFVTPTDFKNYDKNIYHADRYLSFEGMKSLKGKILPPKSVLVTCIGSDMGKVAVNKVKCITNQQINAIIPNKNIIDSDYLYYKMILHSEELKSIARAGTTMPIINKSTFEQIELYIPRIEKQKAIAGVLSLLDDKIEVNKKINDNLAEQAQVLFQKMIKFNELPTDWKIVSVDDVSLNITDGVHNTVIDDSEGSFYLLSCKNIKGGSISIGEKERKINELTFLKLRKRTKLAKGDILLSSVGTVGELVLLNYEPGNIEFQRSVAIIKPNPEIISSIFLYETLLNQKTEIIHAAHGAVQQCIFIGDIKGFKVILPPKQIVDEYDKIVKPMFEQITQNLDQNTYLSDIRDILLPKLMSGELDVSDLKI